MPNGRPAAVVVQGDTNTASAAAQAGNYAGAPVVHVEAGLRSFDRKMPEELNRCVVGVLADLHCAPTERAVANLRAEGVPADRIALTGNTIVEATIGMMPDEAAARAIVCGMGAEPGEYILATIHRPENTDDPERLGTILDELSKLGLPVVIPLHPRTRLAAQRHGLAAELDRLRLVPPVDHRTFLGLARFARIIVSDSGGVQEECTVLKRPLIVIRNSTERPESIEAGFAHLVRPGPAIGSIGRQLINDAGLAERLARLPCPFGDGKASQRITACLQRFLGLQPGSGQSRRFEPHYRFVLFPLHELARRVPCPEGVAGIRLPAGALTSQPCGITAFRHIGCGAVPAVVAHVVNCRRPGEGLGGPQRSTTASVTSDTAVTPTVMRRSLLRRSPLAARSLDRRPSAQISGHMASTMSPAGGFVLRIATPTAAKDTAVRVQASSVLSRARPGWRSSRSLGGGISASAWPIARRRPRPRPPCR